MIALSGILRRLDANGGDGVVVEFRPERSRDDADLLAARAVVSTFSDATAAAAARGAGAGTNGIELSGRGVVINVDPPSGEELLSAWLQELADNLEVTGFTGELVAARQSPLPKAVADHSVLRLGAFVSYRLLSPFRYRNTALDGPPRWDVDPQTTERACDQALTWTGEAGGDAWLQEGRLQVKLGAVEQVPLNAAVARSARGVLTRVALPLGRVRRASFWPWGQALFQVEEPGSSWQETLAAATEPLRLLPSQVDLAFIGWSYGWGRSWMDLGSKVPALPYVAEAEVRNHRELWESFVPDVHGVQLLTAAHLAKAADLSAWEVEQVAAERYLVRARDLAPWYAQREADLDVVDQARRDFGAMILTSDFVAELRRLT
ncbi:MAG: hypothetical protein ACRYF3_15605 [Janthinobacterium lividum]